MRGAGSVKKHKAGFTCQPPAHVRLRHKLEIQYPVCSSNQLEEKSLTLECLPKDLYDEVVLSTCDGILYTEDTHGQRLPTRILCPKPARPTVVDKFTAPKVHDENAELFTNRIVNLKKTQDFRGKAIAKHLPPAP